MTKYFIESPEGKWLTDPEHPEWGWITDNPFKAWAFEEYWYCEELIQQYIEHLTPKDVLLIQEKLNPADIILTINQQEGCLKGYKITKQEFREDRGVAMAHISKLSDSFIRIRYTKPQNGVVELLENIAADNTL